MFQGVIFDVDGTLVESNDAHARAWQEAFEEAGYRVPLELKLPGAAAVMIGDTPYDAEAARRAGVAFIGFRSGGWSDRDLAGALAVYDGPADLLARLDSSPLRRGGLSVRRSQRSVSPVASRRVHPGAMRSRR